MSPTHRYFPHSYAWREIGAALVLILFVVGTTFYVIQMQPHLAYSGVPVAANALATPPPPTPLPPITPSPLPDNIGVAFSGNSMPIPTVVTPPLTIPTAGIPTVVTAPTLPPTAPASSTLRERAITAEAALRTGQLTATIDYGNGSRATIMIRFDLREMNSIPRYQTMRTYQGAISNQTMERITIGDHIWQRYGADHWAIVSPQAGDWNQVPVFLPHIGAASNVSVETPGNTGWLRWYEGARDADITLEVDPVSGVPRQMRQVGRTTGAILSVNYDAWNTEVSIIPPDNP